MPTLEEQVDVKPAFRAPFLRVLTFDVRTGILLLVVFGVVRMVLVLQANVTGTYQLVSLVFVAMAVLPWIVLTRGGRRTIGLVRPSRWRWMLPAALAGAAACFAVYFATTALWGFSVQNPFAYIARTYSNVPESPSEADRLVYFIIYAVISMLFSPIGEELLYRGIAHESLASRLGNRPAALVDAGAFAVTHLAHFGIVFVAGAWAFLPLPALLWVAAMFLSSLVFYAFRMLTGSLLGAIVAHAAFNLAMNYVIFYGVLA
ncbi:CPBP family intramembrane glutamic endopeptidase [Cryobacterium sp. BB736]|uniref:CPBP family intramembrane glutamic endopeptidase n=1 Tax=Cryobacterium sp. BB736 TaxID=2746963 RepID=UPI001875164D